MSRITAPVSKIVRSIGSNSSIRVPAAVAGIETHHGSILSPKYAELLGNRSTEHHDARNITTTHRPTPQPSLQNRSKPLMQSFSSSSAANTPTSHLDASVLPVLHNPDLGASDIPRVPLLPDNYSTVYAPFSTAETVSPPESARTRIVAAVPDRVAPAAGFGEVSGISLDGVDVKFAHDQHNSGSWHRGAEGAAEGQESEDSAGGMLKDIWKGMLDDVLGPKKTTT